MSLGRVASDKKLLENAAAAVATVFLAKLRPSVFGAFCGLVCGDSVFIILSPIEEKPKNTEPISAPRKKWSDNELHQNIRQRRSHRLSIRLSTTVCLSVCRCVSPCLPVRNSEQTLITQKVAK